MATPAITGYVVEHFEQRRKPSLISSPYSVSPERMGNAVSSRLSMLLHNGHRTTFSTVVLISLLYSSHTMLRKEIGKVNYEAALFSNILKNSLLAILACNLSCSKRR